MSASSFDTGSGHGTPVPRARFASVHWVRYPAIRTPDDLSLSERPAGCLSWKIGPDGPVGPDGVRLPSDVWCAVALFRDEASARSALAARERFLPLLATAVESWHAVLIAIAHKGECNHLDRMLPGPIFDNGQQDPRGPLFVMTTAGFDLGPDFNMQRVIDFRRNVDRVREWMRSAPGMFGAHSFAPHTRGDDGVTMSVWADDAAMTSVMYRPGVHRAQIDRYKAEHTADRTSFTRFRAVETCGTWNGTDPIEEARKGHKEIST